MTEEDILADIRDELKALREENQKLQDENRELRQEVEEIRQAEQKPKPPSNEDIVSGFFSAQTYVDSTERPHKLCIKYFRTHLDDKPLCDVTEAEALDFAANWTGQAGDDESGAKSSMVAYLRRVKVLYDWMAEQKAGYMDGAPPTEVVGRIDRETEKAILLDDTAAARPLMKLAHRIHELEQNEGDPDRNDWLDDRLAKHREAFESRQDVPELTDGWLPKSQLDGVIRRTE